MIDEDRSTWTLGKLADEVIEACELPTGCRATIIAALGDAKDQGAAELRHQSCTQPCPDCGRRPPGPQCGKVVQRITNVDGLRIDTETLPACLQRTDADYAIEFGGYLATDAAVFLDACNAFEEAREKHEDAEPGAEAEAAYDVMFAAQEARGEAWSGLRTAIYEFEKRRDRALRHQVCNDDARDAERYRWLVKNCHLHEAPENFGRYTYSKTWLDSRVDECMARHAKGEVGVSADALRALQSHQTSFHVAGKKS